MSTAAVSKKDSGMRWIVNGEEYDLTNFLAKHPGGPDMLLWAVGRDITIPVMTYHKDPERIVLPILKKYKVAAPKATMEEVVKNKIGACVLAMLVAAEMCEAAM